MFTVEVSKTPFEEPEVGLMLATFILENEDGKLYARILPTTSKEYWNEEIEKKQKELMENDNIKVIVSIFQSHKALSTITLRFD